MLNTNALSRRSFMQSMLAAAPIIRGHGKIDPPVSVPDLALVRYDGASMKLLPLVNGHATAIQLMFTSCMTTCPIQAAIFAKVQAMLPAMQDRGIQLLSLSIDPEDDTPAALSAWRQRFHAGPNWIAASPSLADVPRLQDFFGKGGDSSDHSTQVHIVDRKGNLVWRTFELPTPQEIASVLQKI